MTRDVDTLAREVGQLRGQVADLMSLLHAITASLGAGLEAIQHAPQHEEVRTT